jgi:bifunctional non-homologous end joining protein LigD
MSGFIVHQHNTGRPHFDLRLAENGLLRCWSLLREPPARVGEQRLAVERETFPLEQAGRSRFEERAFGEGRVSTWDLGPVDICLQSPRHLVLHFEGTRLSGDYELKRTDWYPGNRWLLRKLADLRR